MSRFIVIFGDEIQKTRTATKKIQDAVALPVVEVFVSETLNQGS